MNDSLIPFEYGISRDGLRQEVRVEMRSGEPWFVAADVCAVLGIKDVSDAVSRVDQADRDQTLIRSYSQNRRMWIVNESGLYDLVLRSDKPESRPFRRWITSQVLPTIRRSGSYQLAGEFEIPQSFAEALELAARQTRQLEAAQAKVIELHPKADAWDTLADTGADYSAREAAYILNRDPAIKTGQNRLLALLREWRVIGRDDRPYANHSAHVTLRPQTRVASDGDRVQAKPQVRITVRGLSYLHNRLGGVAPLDFSEVAS